MRGRVPLICCSDLGRLRSRWFSPEQPDGDRLTLRIGEPPVFVRLPSCSIQSIAAQARRGAVCSMPGSAAKVISCHRASVDSFEPGCTTREMPQDWAKSRIRLADPSSAGGMSFAAAIA